MKKAILYSLLLLLVIAFAPDASAGEREKKRKSYDRPYGRSLDNEYQDDYYRRKRVEKESLFQRDLHEDEDFVFRERPSYSDDRSYMVPKKKKTIPTWGTR